MADQNQTQTEVAAPVSAPGPLPQAQVADPVAANPSPAVDSDERFFAALAYFGPLFMVTLVTKPNSSFCKFHARQSMVLFLVFILFLMVLFMVPMIGSLVTLVLFAVYVLAIYRAYSGELWNIPLVSQFAGKMDVESLYKKAGLAVSGISNLKEKAGAVAAQAAQTAQNLGKQEEPSAATLSAPAEQASPTPPPVQAPVEPAAPPAPPAAVLPPAAQPPAA